MVDVIGYIHSFPVEKDGVVEYDRRLFLRGTERYLAGSRYKHMVKEIPLSYDNLVNAFYDAIDKEVASTGGTATTEENPYTIRNFDDLMIEAKEIWIKISNSDKTNEALNILETVFGKPTKFSEINPEEKDLLEKALILIKDLM